MPILLQINIVSNALSTGLIAEDIAKVASARSWDCYIAFGRMSKPGICKEIRIGSTLNTYEHYIESRIFDNEGLASRLATKRLIKKIKRINPDIIHLHNLHDHYINYKLLFEYLNQANHKVVWTFHDFWAITGHCHHFIDASCEKWKTSCNNCPLQHSTVNSLIDRSRRNFYLKKNLFTANNNLTIVPVSKWVENNIRQSFLKDKCIITIPNGIDLELLINEPVIDIPSIPNNRFVILGVARDWEHGDRKGFDDFLKLSELLKNDEVIVLLGIKKKQMSTLPSNVIGIERTTSKQKIANIYRKANVLLSLSSAETFGLTVIEANAFGVPAIVYDNTAPPSLISPGTGYVVRNKDINDVYEKIEMIKSGKSNINRETCIHHVRKNYDKSVNFRKYVDLYETLIKEK